MTSRIVLVNGEQVEETPLVTTVKKEAVSEIIMVGSKERPPSVGPATILAAFGRIYSHLQFWRKMGKSS